VHKTAITEIKNLNSFSVLERATAYEIQRQLRHWEETGSLGRKSTYGWDEATESTFLQREKEEAHDYRYFPDPDLVPVIVDEAWLTELKAQIGELPAARRKRYIQVPGLSLADAAALAAERQTGDLYDQAVAAGADARRVANLLLSHGMRIANEKGVTLGKVGFNPRRIAELADLIAQNKLAAAEPAGKVLQRMLEKDQPAEHIARELGLMQVSDTGPIDAAIDAVIAANPRALQDYRAGKQAALGAVVGIIMKQGKGLNPKIVQDRLRQKLGL
jgi:aspartyl-tRNA(Asn)/glutamyl-tRNA(Gln) amidotransferase subunit B